MSIFSHINFAKLNIGSVSGSITDAETGSGLSEAELQAFKVDANGDAINNWPDFHVWLDSDKLSSGSYNVQFPAGKYILRIKVWDFTTAYDTVYSGGVTSKSQASVVTVTKDTNTSGVNFSMTRAAIATITGKVTDENDQKLNTKKFKPESCKSPPLGWAPIAYR